LQVGDRVGQPHRVEAELEDIKHQLALALAVHLPLQLVLVVL
jgi:hypothetical protein